MCVEEPQGITRVGQTVLAGLMESQIWHRLLALWFCWGKAQKRDSGLCQPFCLGESCPDTRQFSSSLYASEAFQPAAPMLMLRGSEFEYVRVGVV